MTTIDDFTRPKEFLSPLEKYIGGMIREWAENDVIPYRRKFNEDWKDHNWVEPAMKKLYVDIGLQKAVWPKEVGGWGLGQSDHVGTLMARVFEEVGRADTGIAVASAVTFWPLIMIALKPHINEELCAEFAPMFCDADEPRFAANAMTEPQGGSDIENMGNMGGKTITTTAELDGDEWVINGHKLWPTNTGGVADLFGVICTTKQGSSDEDDFAFIFVPADTEGVTQGEPYKKAGMAADKNSDIWFENVRVPKKYRAWGAGDDAKYFREVINWGSMSSAAFCVGAMMNTYEILKEYCSNKIFRGKPLKENTAVAAVLSDIAKDIEICRIATYQSARTLDRPELYWDKWSHEGVAKSRAVKMHVADKCIEVTNNAASLMGTYGCDRDWDVEKHWRDVKMIQLWMGGKQLCQMETARWFYGCETL